MPNSLDPKPPEQSLTESASHRSHATLLKIGAGFGVLTVIGAVAIVVWGDRVINTQVLPRVEQEIEKTLERPVDIGEIAGFSLWGIRLGKTTLPPTATDQTSATVEEIGITVDLRSLLFQRTLKPNLVLVRPEVNLVQAKDGQWIELTLPEPTDEEPPITVELQTIEVQDARVTASTLIQDPAAVVPREPVLVEGANVTAEFRGKDAQQVAFDLAGTLDSGQFAIQGEGDLDQQAVKANIRLQDLPTQGVNLFLPAIAGIKTGLLNTQLTAAAALTTDGQLDLDAVDLQGTARLRDGEVLISDLPEPLRNIRSQLRFQGQKVTLEETGLQLGEVQLMAAGDVDLQEGYNLNAQIPAVSIADVQTLAAVELPLEADGTFQLDTRITGALLDPQVRGRLANRQPMRVDKVNLATVIADFDLTRTLCNLRELRLVPEAGGVVLAQGEADLSDLKQPQFQLTGQVDLPVDAFTQLYAVTLPENTTIGRLTADLTVDGDLEKQNALARWQLSESSFPGEGEITLADKVVVVDNTRLQVADGTVTPTATAQLDGGDWQATVATVQIPVEQFTPQVRGLLDADLEAAGNLYDFDLAKIRAGGRAAIADAEVRLTPTSDPLLQRGDWNTAFEWQGDSVAIQTFTAPGVQADGTVGVDFAQTIPLGEFALNLSLREIDLQPFNSLAPVSVQEYVALRGLTSFQGTVSGNLANPQLAGNARLDGLGVNQIGFESLAGPIALSLAKGGSLDLRGQQDRVQLEVSDRPWPVTFAIQNRDFVVQGTGEGNRIQANISQFPLALLDVQPAADLGLGTLTGLVDASLEADLTDFRAPLASGTVTVTQPGLDPVVAEVINADFRYANQTAFVDQGELRLEQSRFFLTGQAALAPDLQYDGKLTIAEGRIEDLVAIAQAIDFSALGVGQPQTKPTGSATDLDTTPAGLPNASFLDQLENFIAFVDAQPADAATSGTLAIPPLDSLSGGFRGVVTIAGQSPEFADLTADFDLQGDRWQWGPYAPANQFLVRGNVQQETVTLEPVVITAEDTVINLAGSGNFDRLTGTLQIDNLPLELAAAIYPLPVSIAGDLDVITQLDGSLANPLAAGKAAIANAQVNEYPLHQAEANFNYRNATLDLDGTANLTADQEPMTLIGQVPYALPFMKVQPPTEQIAVKAVVPGDNFDWVNVLTQDQVRWERGEGEVVVQIGGTLQQPAVAGQASVRDAVVSAAQLGDPLTNLNGEVQFNLERVGISQLQANLGEGTVEVTGQLPLLPSGQSILATATTKQQRDRSTQADGILVALTELPIDYAGILQAIFDGNVVISGAVLAPTVSGEIDIGEGQIRANELLSKVGNMSLPTQAELEEINPYRAEYLGIDPFAPQPTEPPTGFLDQVALQDFVVAFSDRLVVAGQPFYNITAEGGVTVNGTLADLQPAGSIALQSGWINLFSTQFRLDANAPNTATFTPEDGLDPYVDVVMTARVQETDVTRVPQSSGGFSGSEINDTDIESVGEVQYINIEAIAQGYASELSDSLALESRPSRSQQELVALLGSSVAGGLSGASFTQFAGFLGAGSLAGFGNDLADTLGLQSFSVFPTTDTSTESTAGIGIGVEGSFAIGNSIGINILEVLNNGNPPQVGLQYRFTEELQLEGSSNLEDTEVRLEYRTSF